LDSGLRAVKLPRTFMLNRFRTPQLLSFVTVVFASFLVTGCASKPPQAVGQRLERKGDEIVVAGQLFHTGTRVVLWTDPHGYDAYRTERRFAPWDEASYEATKAKFPTGEIAKSGPARYGIRRSQIDDQTFERVRGGGWDLPTLQQCVDQFVYHYDVAGVSRNCFKTLQDGRALSVQFMCDIDGTIYQTLDVKERAWQATKANSRSIGIEIANMGAYRNSEAIAPLKEWYAKDADGRTRITIPARLGDGGVLTQGRVFRPARNDLIEGDIQNTHYRQYDFTPEQYAALSKLTAALCTVLPKITCDAPREADGRVINHQLPDDQYATYQGLMGHYHVQGNKQDPGPAFDWERVINGARKQMSSAARAANKRERGHPALPKNDSPSSAPSTTARAAADAANAGGQRRRRNGASTQPASATTTQP
jgi:N-acetylmuramoyl-L-alanine amidase